MQSTTAPERVFLPIVLRHWRFQPVLPRGSLGQIGHDAAVLAAWQVSGSSTLFTRHLFKNPHLAKQGPDQSSHLVLYGILVLQILS